MAEFAVNTHRQDPYKNFKFRLKWDGRYVAGISRISALKRVTEVVEVRDGGDPSNVRRSPGLTRFEPITIERGVTHDLEFERWANKVWQLGGGQGGEVSLKDFRKDMVLEIYNEAGQLVLAYLIYRCWPSEFQVLPDLDANGNGVAIQSLVIQNEGFERDRSVGEPEEGGGRGIGWVCRRRSGIGTDSGNIERSGIPGPMCGQAGHGSTRSRCVSCRPNKGDGNARLETSARGWVPLWRGAHQGERAAACHHVLSLHRLPEDEFFGLFALGGHSLGGIRGYEG